VVRFLTTTETVVEMIATGTHAMEVAEVENLTATVPATVLEDRPNRIVTIEARVANNANSKIVVTMAQNPGSSGRARHHDPVIWLLPPQQALLRLRNGKSLSTQMVRRGWRMLSGKVEIRTDDGSKLRRRSNMVMRPEEGVIERAGLCPRGL